MLSARVLTCWFAGIFGGSTVSNSAYKLIIEDDEGRRSVVPVDLGASQDVSLGRDQANTICLNERNVSRRHARFFEDPTGIFAEDLSSYNGVWINGDRIQKREPVFQGDVLRVGDFNIELRGEGLHARRDETTQRTVGPVSEPTQPGFKMIEDSIPASEMTMDAAPPLEPLSFEEPAEPSGRSREEKTAIIRMSDYDLKDESLAERLTIAGQRAKLICVTTQFAGLEFEIDKTEVIIGRTDENDIGLDHRSVSRHHSRIVVDGNRYTVFDNGSANGTFVNDEEYASVELKSGDVIELGHVKLRFVPPGETYSFTEEELKAVQDARGATNPGVTVTETPDEVTDVRKMPNQTMLLGGVVLVVVLLLIWAVVAATLGGSSEPAQPRAAEVLSKPAPPQAQKGGALEELLAEANNAAKSRRWSRALDLARAAVTLSPSNPEAMALEKRVMAERDAQGHVEAARQSIAAGNWEEAWNRLSEIPTRSVYYEEASPLIAQARGALITERIAEAYRVITARDWDAADVLAAEIATLDGQRPELVQIQSEIRQGRAEDEAAAQVASQKARTKPKRSAPKQVVRTPVAKPAATKPAPAPKPAPEPPAAPVANPQELYTQGALALKDGQYDKAVEYFRRCVQVNKNYDRCYRAMGIVYARKGDPAKAARYYRKYLQVSPNAADANQVRELLKQYEGNE